MPNPIKPTQADIEAVAAFHKRSFECLFTTTDEEIDAGINRAHTLLCKAFALHAQQAREQALEEVVTEMEVKWGHIVTPELRDAIRSLKEPRP